MALMAVVLSVGFSACGDKTSVTGKVYDIGATSASFVGYVNLSPTKLATATFGIIWGTEEDLKWDNKVGFATSRNLLTNKYSVTTHDLVPETKYFYRSYVCLNGNTYVYGAVKSFTTHSLQIELQTGEASDIKPTSATLSASVQQFPSELSVSSLGIIWGTTEDLTWEIKKSYANCRKLDGGKFSVIAAGLLPETKYYYRVYFITNEEVIYGSTRSFATTSTTKPLALAKQAVELEFTTD